MDRARTFTFGPFRLSPERQLLTLNDLPVRIGGRALDLLTLLVERPGQVVSKTDLIAAAWPDTFVDEANLKVNMGSLRRVLGCGQGADYIATVIGRGYRFVAPVSLTSRSSAPETRWRGLNDNFPGRSSRSSAGPEGS
ncbi:MAG: transcriptional regulator [Brevundimonas sp.]|nr:MAG: transcriptional regulator [Brevundimonas sp.]